MTSLRRLLSSVVVLLVSFVLLPPATVAQTYNCQHCVDNFNGGDFSQICDLIPGDGGVSCVNPARHCPGADCCGGKRSGTCTDCTLYGLCYGNGQCTGNSECPDNGCCVDGSCYPQGPGCQGGYGPQLVQRPSQETWAAYPWITQPERLMVEVSAHSTHAQLMRVALDSLSRLQLIYGVHPSVAQRVTSGGESFVIRLTTDINHKGTQTLTLYALTPDSGPADPIMATIHAKPSLAIDTLTLVGEKWTLTNAKGTFTGDVDPYVPVADPKPCAKKTATTSFKEELK